MAAKSKATLKNKAKPAPRAKTKSRAKAKSRPKTKRKVAKAANWRVVVRSLADVRSNIDRLDDLIAPLLCQRLYFVTQAANFKPSVVGVVVPARVEEIISRVRMVAEKMGSNPDTLERVYRNLIDAFTADEQAHWRSLNR